MNAQREIGEFFLSLVKAQPTPYGERGADAQRIDRQGQELSGGKLPHHLHRITVQWHPGLLAEAMDGPHRL